MTSKLNFGRDTQGMNAYAPDFPTVSYSATLVSGAASSVTVPADFENYIVVFSYQPGANVWVCRTAAGATPVAATAPAASTFGSTTSILNPAARHVYAGDSISLLTDNTSADVGVSFYATYGGS